MIWVWITVGVMLLLLAGLFLVRRPAPQRPAPAPAKRPEGTMVLREEQLDLHKRQEKLADVTAHTEVIRTVKTLTVPVAREDLVVEKDGVETLRIPLQEERVEVAKHAVPLNDVSISKRAWQESKSVEAVLKKEVARVETSGEATVSEE